MNLETCETCGIVFDKDVLLSILIRKNTEGKRMNKAYIEEYSLECPVCKKGKEFHFWNEKVT